MRDVELSFVESDPRIVNILKRRIKSYNNNSQRHRYLKRRTPRYDVFKNHRRATNPAKYHCSTCRRHSLAGHNSVWHYYSYCGFPFWEIDYNDPKHYNPMKPIYIFLVDQPYGSKFCLPKYKKDINI